MMLKKSLQFTTIFLIAALLQACGVSGTGGGESTGNSGSTFNDTNPEPVEVIGFQVEQTTQAVSQMTMVALDHNFQVDRSYPLPNFRIQRNEDGDLEIQFEELYVEQVNLVLKVRFENDAVLYAPLYTLDSINESITVNVVSHYVLQKLFATLETEEDLDKLLPCSTSNCPNQALTKAALLEQITNMAQAYELSIPDFASTNDGIEFLDEQLDFKTHIETTVAEISRTTAPIAKGTPRAFSLTDGDVLSRLTSNVQYNSLRFAISLNDLEPDNGQAEVRMATETSIIVAENELDNVLPIYPNYSLTTFLFDIQRESVQSDIPFRRTSLSIFQNKVFTLDSSEPINSFSSAIADAFTSTEGSLLDNRTVEQAIPEPETIGWQFNPLFSKLYHANEYQPDDTAGEINEETPDFGVSPTWLLGANYGTGGSFHIKKNNDGFDRLGQIEDLNIFSWEIHGQETDTSFSIDQLNGKKYGVINFSLNLADGTATDSDKIIELFAETEEWLINSGTAVISQPTSHYTSHVLSRDKDYLVERLTDITTISETSHSIFTLKTNESSQQNPTGKKEIQGLISLDGGAFAPTGHSTQDGKHLAFVYKNGQGRNAQDRGRGITIATELRSLAETPIFGEEERYTLLGNTVGINETENTLRSLNNSTLTLSDRQTSDDSTIDCHASLVESSVSLAHTIGDGTGENTLAEPVSNTLSSIESSTCRLSEGKIEISFNDNDDNTTLTLRGFMSPQDKDEATNDRSLPGNVMTLLWIQEDNLGLVFATKDQKLCHQFLSDSQKTCPELE